MPISERGSAGHGVQAPVLQLERAVQFDLDRLVRAGDLPRVLAAQPVVRLFVLPAVLDGLFEDAVFVTQPVAHGRELHRRHRIEKAGRQATEPAVSQPGVGFLFDEAEPVEVASGGDLLHKGIEQKIGDIVGERSPDQKLHRQIIDPLRVLPVIGAVGQNPALRQHIAHRTRGCLEALARSGGFRSDDVVEKQVPLVQGVVVAGEPDRATAVPGEKLLVRDGLRYFVHCGYPVVGRGPFQTLTAGSSW